MPEGLFLPTTPVTTFNDGRATMTGRWRNRVLQPEAGLADLPPPPRDRCDVLMSGFAV